MAGLADILQGLATVFGTPVPGAPLPAGAAGPPNPSTVSYLPAIETGLAGLAGLLQPQNVGPYGRRTWGAALSNGILSGLQGYNAGENQLLEQQRLGAENQMNQQKLASGALQLKSDQALMNQYGNINPDAIKLLTAKAEATNFAKNALQIAADPKTSPQDKLFYTRVGNLAASTGSMDAVQKLVGIDKDRLAAAVDQTKLDMAPLEREAKQANIAHSEAGTAHERAETGRVGIENAHTSLENEEIRRRMAGTMPTAATGERVTTELAEARREYENDVKDPDTGLVRPDAPTFDDWIKNEWSKRRAAIRGGSGAAEAARPARSSPPTPTSAPESLHFPGIGDLPRVRVDKSGRGIYRFPDGTERVWKGPATS